jgi:serine/threonine protein kinase
MFLISRSLLSHRVVEAMQVLQVRHKVSGKIFAMKVLNKKSIMDRNEIKQLKTEKSILMKLSSPFLVKLYFSFQTPDKFYFVMDYINGGELFSHLQRKRKFKPDRARFYSAEIVLGLEYLHNQGIVYRFVGEQVSLDCTPC